MEKITNRKIIILISVLLFLPLFVGCFGAPPTNQPPTITSTPITTATVDELYFYDVAATDPDGDPLIYSLTSNPTGMTIDSVTGVISWTPTFDQIGDNDVTVEVSDGLLSDSQNFIIIVSEEEGPGYTPPPSPPTVVTNNVFNIASSSAQLNGNLDSTGGFSCQVWFEYGKTSSYGSSTPKQSKSSTGSFIQAISSLDSDTTYHFRACASNTEGTDYGADETFITPDTITNLKLTPASQTVLIGNEGTVNIVVENVTNLLSGDITLTFDDSKLAYISSALGSFFSNGFKDALATGGSLNIAFATTDVVKPSGTGTVLTVTFERIASGVTDICFDTTVLTNQGGIDFPHTQGGCAFFN